MKSILCLALALFSAQFQLSAQFKPIDYTSSYRFTQEILNEITAETPQWKYQIIAPDFAAIGQDSLALGYWDKAFGARSVSLSRVQKDSINALYSMKSAKEVIVEQSQSHELLIINEAHHINQHRLFTARLLDSLYAHGYRYFGLEALANNDTVISSLNERGYLALADGYYTKSPAFATLINHALDLGFELFAYEAQEGLRNGDREQGQAVNIFQFMKTHQEGKYLIHCGFDHALEGKHRKWESAMAERLKILSGLDPLTIDQVNFAPRHVTSYSPALLQALTPQQSVVLYNQNGQLVANKKGEGIMDLVVMHPDELSLGYDVIIEGIEELDLSFPIQLLAFPATADIEKATASVVQEYEQSQVQYAVSLLAGSYQLVVRSAASPQKAFLKRIKVD